MHRLGPGQTTVPAKASLGAAGRAGSLAIAWVFPEEVTTPLTNKRTLLGRDEGCDTVLLGRETSRRHAEVCWIGPVPALRDLGSRNGAFVNGERTTESPLSPGDVVRLGEWVGLVVAGAAEFEVRELAPGLLGGARFAAAIEPARHAAPGDVPIVVEGETGTGKECLARAIHTWSGRRGDFVAVNCAALPESLAEAELFGHRKGAFSGALRDSLGYFRAAHRGTLLLDEVLDLPPPIAAKLLRVLEQGEVVPLGDTRPVPVDVRVIAAAQSSLGRAVDERRFRPDLYARLSGVEVTLPPLRQRREDIPALFRHFLERHSGGNARPLAPGAVEALCLHPWPMNVRELAQLARRLLATRSGRGEISLEELSAALPARSVTAASAPSPAARSASRKEQRESALLDRLGEALKLHAGNVTKAAAALGISRQRAYRLLARRPQDLDSMRFPASSEPDEDHER